MLRIQVHPDELEAKARLVQQCKLELDRIVRELDKSIYFLQSEWSGATREQFFWDFMEVKGVFPATLGKLDEIQKEFTFIANNFRTTDSTGEVALYIPDELKPSFFTGAVDKAIGDTVTGLGETVEALFYNPLSTLGSLAYAMTIGKAVDVGRGLAFAWDAAWGTGTARSDIEQFVDEKKKQFDEDESGYAKGAIIGQALSYLIFGRALHSKDHHGSGGGGKKESWKINLKDNYSRNNLIEPSMSKGGIPKGNYANREGGRGNIRQNESANLLADQGYDIEMLDEVVGGNGYGIKKGKNPDFIIEGRVFDCYSPDSDTPIDSICAKIKYKTKSQAQRIVLNLDDYPSEKIDELLETVLRQTNSQANLKHLDELVVIKDGEINKVFGR
ncbi:WXG100 family type VII secretion target [Paenibacillus silvae]|uniref:CdiA C-terminal domain-containing protein n=1 Tax=Paenibacillus silvae TaxID=1325358 RepID=UPI0025A22054|nr:WXG100 family type VII secretion target [Paenibacillus silvae]MDM5279685.1 WXG100 family type VII secretion target [Paenibacillus silvae]